jgi:signal transduction histidine kinase
MVRLHSHYRGGMTEHLAQADSFEAWRDHFTRDRLTTLYYLGLTANPVFLVSDFLFYREHLSELLSLRVLLELGFAVVFLLLVRRRTAIPPQAPLFLWVLIGNICIAQMTVSLGGFASAYYNGLNLVYLAAAVIVPVSWTTHVAAQATTLLYYYGVNLLHPLSVGAETAALQNSFFLLWTCVACLFSVFLYEKLQSAEFQARLSERRAREELEISHRKLLELDRLKDQFFANINHELRTPLTLSLGAFRTLLRAPLTQESQAVVQSGLRNTARLLFLINELLELARFESGRADLRKSCVDLAILIKHVSANFESSERQRIFLDGAGSPLPAQVDVAKMTKVFSNLLMNAFKFSPPEEGKVWISLAHQDDEVAITIRDNGIGIPEDQLERIFDRFTQVEGQATRRFEGTGIGLALAKEIVTLHGGRIAVQSHVGQGSTFTVTLPRGNADPNSLVPIEAEDAPVLAPPAEESLEAASEMLRESTADGRPVILAADDNADMRAYLVRLLSDDYRVISACNGEDALKQAVRLQPALVLADVMMPVMSGHDLLKAMRSDDALRAIPVILLTARAGTEARVESLEAGADDYVSKPFHEEELLARIKNQLRIHAQERELEAKAQQLQQLYSKLEIVNADLRAVSLRKSEFVSIVSHDLRTPLAAMNGFVTNLLDGIAGPLTEKQRHYLDRIRHNIDRLVRMIKDLLDLSKIEAGTMRLDIRPVSLSEIAEHAVETCHALAWEKGITVRIIRPDQSPSVQADADRLLQVLTNLLHNACKFTPSGGDVRLELGSDPEGMVQICVADSGCGISADELPRVFEKFYRGAAQTDLRGAGLGLAIAKDFVELQFGRMWVESAPGQGSRFYFTLPPAVTSTA